MKVLTTVDELKVRGLWNRAWDIITKDFGKESGERTIDTTVNPPTVTLTEAQARKLGILQPFFSKETEGGFILLKSPDEKTDQEQPK